MLAVLSHNDNMGSCLDYIDYDDYNEYERWMNSQTQNQTVGV
jgi:hypothetical protein